MFARLRRLWAPPVMQDPLRHQQARLLQSLLLAMAAILTLAILSNIFLFGGVALTPGRLGESAVGLIAILGGLVLLGRGAFTAAVGLLIAGLLAGEGWAIAAGGVQANAGALIE